MLLRAASKLHSKRASAVIDQYQGTLSKRVSAVIDMDRAGMHAWEQVIEMGRAGLL